MHNNKKIIVFDLDGVLINSKKNMQLSLELTNKILDLDISFKEYEKYIGLPFRKILKNLGVKKNQKLIEKTYKNISLKNLRKIHVKKSIIKILKRLKKRYDLAIFTSKDKTRTLRILKTEKKLFNYIVTPQDVNYGKPNPQGLKIIRLKGGYEKKNMIYVGDSEYDFLAAKKMKIKYLHATWGYSSKFFRNINIHKIKKIEEIEKVSLNFFN